MRGALYDLAEAEAGGGADRWEGLTEEERAEEERCDYERYLALYHDDIQYQAFQGKTITIIALIVTVAVTELLRERKIKFYIFTIMAFVYVCVFGLYLVQLPTFDHREHLIASILM